MDLLVWVENTRGALWSVSAVKKSGKKKQRNLLPAPWHDSTWSQRPKLSPIHINWPQNCTPMCCLPKEKKGKVVTWSMFASTFASNPRDIPTIRKKPPISLFVSEFLWEGDEKWQDVLIRIYLLRQFDLLLNVFIQRPRLEFHTGGSECQVFNLGGSGYLKFNSKSRFLAFSL